MGYYTTFLGKSPNDYFRTRLIDRDSWVLGESLKASYLLTLNIMLKLPKLHPKITQGLILFSCWILLPLLLVEILMTVLDPILFTKGLYQYDPDLGFRVRPYANESNLFGFNDQDYPLEKDPGTYRILILSDSFNWAGGREGNYTTFLEQKFEQYYGKHRVDIINAGYPGTHTGEQLEILRKYGLQYQPDLVVLGFFVGNDFVDAEPERKRIIVNDLYVDINRDQELIIFGYPIIPQSRFWLFLQQKYKIFSELSKSQPQPFSSPFSPPPPVNPQSIFPLIANQPTAKPPTITPAPPPSLSLETFLTLERARLEFCNTYPLYQTGAYQPQIDYILERIGEMQTLLSNQNIQFLVAIYPDEFQVNDQLFQTIMERFNVKPEYYERECQQNILKPFLTDKNIPYIDFLEPFKQAQKQQPLYLVQEPHWNGAGNQLAADLLFQTLVKTTDSFFSAN